MYRFRPLTVPREVLFLLVLLLPAHSFAQVPSKDSGGMIFVATDALDPHNSRSLAVQVRDTNGSKLDKLAVVTVYRFSGQTVGSRTTSGSRAIFGDLGAGSYFVDVEALGYEKVRVQTDVVTGIPQQVLVVTLKPDTSGALSVLAPDGLMLSPKAEKETNKALEELRANKFDDSIKHLEAAQRLAPTHPYLAYVLGLAYEKKDDNLTARKYWDRAIQLDPKHVSSLLACANSFLRQGDAASARRYLDKAVEAAPNSWRAHSLLASALLRQKSYIDAVTHAERAMELGKDQDHASALILGQALAAQQLNEQAIAALQTYLAGKPPAPQAEAVQKMIESLKNSPRDAGSPHTSNSAVFSPGAAIAVADDLSELPLTAAALHWFPPSVDEALPLVEPGIGCSLDDVLGKVSANVKAFPALVDRFTATEMLLHEDMSEAGYITHAENTSFNYLASIRELQGKYLDVEEYRNGSMGTDMFPSRVASTGLPALVLIFHPLLISDFEMKCEGLSRINGRFAWQVHFRQRGDQTSRIRVYRLNGRVFPIFLKGRAWIDANNFQVVRLETDLREPYPDLRLLAEHLVMEYGPVQFKTRNEQLWLPTSADYYRISSNRRIHRRHSFSDYVLFSVEDKQKIGEPSKEKTAPQAPPEINPSE
jgi:tetratricopeptide (TPR) repeat protein